jgi:hypothetical protein
MPDGSQGAALTIPATNEQGIQHVAQVTTCISFSFAEQDQGKWAGQC